MTTHSRKSRATGQIGLRRAATPGGVALGSPWTTQMYAVYGGLAGLGAVLFGVGMTLVSSETLYDNQVPGINLAIVGAVLANAAGAVLLLAGRRAVLARRVRVLGAVPKAVEQVDVVVVGPAASPALVAGEGLVHFHRADCVMASGRDWPAVDRPVHERAGRIACGVCKP